ncbi:molybdopterin-dependent oxidoreductase [Phenylobacterium sp.]|uniref:molybdopterin-dependent oxidoreductase n=1 Tax=Phenylobacterium sp. TaxID=1871053 RepID=UPI002730ADF0|nr:molybdopterin-dependent oxidoreductase [Phenylobacterium sp.]MDP2213025.1 molybdopterin-dependent oxidoreductase [Phenylobacterium sp.]
MRPFLLASLLLVLAAPAAAQDVTISRADGTEVTLSAADLADLPRAQVSVTGAAGPKLYEGPPLAYVMRAAGLPVGMRAHGDPMRGYLVVRGADGYAAVISAFEADKDLHGDVAILADTVDGEPLPEREGPRRVVIADDLKSWRSVRKVVAIDYRIVE